MENLSEHDGSPDDVRRRNADAFLADDIASSRSKPRLLTQESGEALGVGKRLCDNVKEVLTEYGVYSRKELQSLLVELDTALAISNDPEAMEMRKDLKQRFGPDVKE
ncbi:MAG: hypothetical protein Q7S52_04390 [bacterium]|nr:hypothetical protein [bacterium]